MARSRHGALVAIAAAAAIATTTAGCLDTDDGEDPGVPAVEYCDPTVGWDPAWTAFEQEVLGLVNQHRAAGFDCDTAGSFGPTSPLSIDPALQCAARVHSLDMLDRGFFDHVNPDGDAPDDRIERAGYSWRAWGENIAHNQSSAQRVVEVWMESDGHCSNIMDPVFAHIGIGHSADSTDRYWTQTFGAPL